MKQYLLIIALFALLQISNAEVSESDTLWVKEIGNEVKTVKFSPDGEYIYAAAIGRKPMKLSTATGEILQEYEGFKFEGNVFFLAMDVSKDGTWLVCGAYGNEIKIFDTETGLLLKTLKITYQEIQSNKFNTVAITPDKRYVIATNMFLVSPIETMNGIIIWDAQSGELLKEINSVNAMKVEASPDNEHFAVSYYNSEIPTEIQIYKIGTWELEGSLCCHSNLIQDIAFSEDGSLLASGDMDGKIKIWDTKKKELVKEMGDEVYIYSLGFIDNNKIISGCGWYNKKNMKIWDIVSGNSIGQLKINHPLDLDINILKHYCVVANATSGILLFDYLKLITSIKTDIPEINFTITPNPANNGITIKLFLPEPSDTKIEILDINSNQITLLYTGLLETGNQEFNWLSSGVPSGVYFCRITSKNQTKTYKIILEK